MTAVGHSQLSGSGPLGDHFSIAQKAGLIASTVTEAQFLRKAIACGELDVTGVGPELPLRTVKVIRARHGMTLWRGLRSFPTAPVGAPIRPLRQFASAAMNADCDGPLPFPREAGRPVSGPIPNPAVRAASRVTGGSRGTPAAHAPDSGGLRQIHHRILSCERPRLGRRKLVRPSRSQLQADDYNANSVSLNGVTLVREVPLDS
jgi:hypothetical protein